MVKPAELTKISSFEWTDLIKHKPEKIKEKDMIWSKYPSDMEIIKSEVRGLYIGNFFKCKNVLCLFLSNAHSDS